jgi:hypothetical protein
LCNTGNAINLEDNNVDNHDQRRHRDLSVLKGDAAGPQVLKSRLHKCTDEENRMQAIAAGTASWSWLALNRYRGMNSSDASWAQPRGDIHGGGVVPCAMRGTEEEKIVPESISEIQYYQIIRSQIEHEDNLINQRLSWFVAAHAFLFSAYAILLNAPSQVRLERFGTQRELLFFLIPLVAIGVSILIYMTVIAAMLATANLRRLLKTHMNEKDSALLPPVQGFRQTLLLGQASLILIPVLFMMSWIVLLFKSL